MSGKGDNRRPQFISAKEWDENWHRVFGSPVQVEEEKLEQVGELESCYKCHKDLSEAKLEPCIKEECPVWIK